MSFPAYEDRKETGVDWLGKIPIHWEIVPLKYLVSIRGGGTPSKANEEYREGGDVPWASSKDLKSESLHDTIDHITEVAIQDNAADMVDAGSLLVVVRGMILAHTFPVVKAIVSMAINQDLKALMPQDGIQTDYLCWTLRGSSRETLDRVDEAAHGTKVLRMDSWLATPFAIPPLDEQEAISSFLDVETSKIDGLVSEQRRLIQLLKEKRQAVISHAVTNGLNPNAPMKPSGIQWLGDVPQHWSITRLSYFATIENGSTPSRDNLDYWENGTVPWVSSGEVNQYRVKQPSELITEQALADCPVRLLPKGTVVVGMIGQGKTRGLAAILDIEATINQNLAAIVPGEKLKSAYLHFIFQSIYVFLREFGRGGNQAALNCQILGAMTIPVPPVEEQSNICNYVEERLEKFDQLQAEAERAIELLQERRTALISAAVTGKIDVRRFVQVETA